ncbi:MAG: DUF357 domain-containing protein [Candidatus Hadarchaeota archaeon]|nr:DUF357 domain-containing protein [Candidatus Hadarchaeota archaeon]
MLKDELRQEIEKWSKRLDEKIPGTSTPDDEGVKLLEDVRAYREDSIHFLEQDDLIKSFECLIWAWALLETGKRLGHLAAP